MDLQNFWKSSKLNSLSFSSIEVNFFLDSLASLLDVSIEIYYKKENDSIIYGRWRTPASCAGVLNLGLEGFFSITVQKGAPRVRATVFVFSCNDKLFPKEAIEGYFDLEYDFIKGWQHEGLGWYMDEGREFLCKKYTGILTDYQLVTVSYSIKHSIADNFLYHLLTYPIDVSGNNPIKFSSQQRLFGILTISFEGELKILSDNPYKSELVVRYLTNGKYLFIGKTNQGEKLIGRLPQYDEKHMHYEAIDRDLFRLTLEEYYLK